MSKHEFNGIEAAKVNKVRLVDGSTFTDCYIDPFTESPPGFIAMRPGTIEAGKPVIIKFVKVSNIAYFNIEEGEAGKLWQQFNPLPETIAAKTV